MSETAPLDFMEDDVTWVVSNISGAAGTLGSEVIGLKIDSFALVACWST